MTLYFIFGKKFEGLHLAKNQFGIIFILGWLTIGFSFLHAGEVVSKYLYQTDLFIREIYLLQDIVKKELPEIFDELYPKFKQNCSGCTETCSECYNDVSQKLQDLDTADVQKEAAIAAAFGIPKKNNSEK